MPDTPKSIRIEDNDNQGSHRGRPRNLDIFQQLAHDIAYEPADIESDPIAKTRLEALLRDWLTSKDFRKQKAVIELILGKLPRSQVAQKKTKPIIVEWSD